MDGFAQMCEEVARHASRRRKLEILTEYLNGLTPENRALALRFLRIGPLESRNDDLFDTGAKPKLLVSHRALRIAVSKVTGWDEETLRVCYTQVGDSGETASLLLQEWTQDKPLSLVEAEALYERIARPSSKEQIAIVVDVMRTYRPLHLKYFIKVITRTLRIGLSEKMLDEAAGRPAPSSKHTLTVVVTSAERGGGEQGSVPADCTVAVRSGDQYVNVGKAILALAESELAALARTLRKICTEQFGRLMLVRPEVVLEVAFDRVDKNPRRKSGYALKNPSVVRWHRDRKPHDCDDVTRLETLYRAGFG